MSFRVVWLANFGDLGVAMSIVDEMIYVLWSGGVLEEIVRWALHTYLMQEVCVIRERRENALNI